MRLRIGVRAALMTAALLLGPAVAEAGPWTPGQPYCGSTWTVACASATVEVVNGADSRFAGRGLTSSQWVVVITVNNVSVNAPVNAPGVDATAFVINEMRFFVEGPTGRRERRSGDRRDHARRRVELVVPVKRRLGDDRRGVERRQAAAVLAVPRAWGTGPLQAVLAQAIRRVEAGWANTTGDAESAGEVSELLAAISRTLLLGDQPDARLRSTLGRRLLELVRAELVRHAAGAEAALRSGQLWQLMVTIEALRSEIEPHWHEHFASRLAGPGGLELVVEVAHDLRSPLTSVLFLTEVLAQGQSGPVNDLQRRQLGLIYSAALGLTELADDVLELARGGNRLTDGEPSPFSITAVMMSVRDIVRPMAEEKGIEVRVLPPTSDHRLGHAVALSRVLLNLTTNALKFTREGYVEIGARETAVSNVEFWVRDTGPGIDLKAVETLYSAFRRGPAERGYMLSGTGLGLSLCRRLVSVMCGTLEVETRKDWGTRFYFALELEPVDLL